MRYQPYTQKHQTVELVLIVSTACAALLSCAYPYVDGGARPRYRRPQLLLMFGPVDALLLWWGVACFQASIAFVPLDKG